ncbi:MAG: antitoxin Xre/MbcA/ParS toxin-binding domain-containing protein [Chitinivorax sp.]
MASNALQYHLNEAPAVYETPHFLKLVRDNRHSNPLDRIGAVRQGFAVEIIDDMSTALGLSKARTLEIIDLAPTTEARLRKKQQPLDQATSEKIDRIAEFVALADDVLGSRESGIKWLLTPNLALANATPMSLLDVAVGAEQVRRILNAISYGGAF